MPRQLSQLFITLFTFCWVAIILLDYWYYHQAFLYQPITGFEYFDLLLLLGIGGGGVYFLNRRKIKQDSSGLRINGLLIFGLFTLLCIAIILSHISKMDLPFSFTGREVFRYTTYVVGVIFITYLICTACYALGDFVHEKLFSLSFKQLDNILIRLALGITLFCLLLFVLGALQVLTQLIVGGVLLAMTGVFYKRSWQFVQSTLLKPISLQPINGLGIASFGYILLFIASGYLHNIRPFPMGFDALAIYLNVPNLIGQQAGLIEGYSPYYWSLFSAVGHILFDSLSIVLSLAVLGGILSGFTIYAICRKWVNPNYALLAVALFCSLPMINWQFYRDVKTDLGLLFFMLAVLLVIVNYLVYLKPEGFPKPKIIEKKQPAKQGTKRSKKQPVIKEVELIEQPIASGWLQKLPTEYQFFILMGIFSGMALGIKLTGLILIFSVIGLLVYLQVGTKGFLTASILFLAIILLGGLDISSGLRGYHFGANYIKWIALGLGLTGFVFLWVSQKQAVSNVLKYIAIYSLFVVLLYLPWPIKNFSETGKASISTFIEGKPAGIPKDFSVFLKNAKKK